MNEMIEKKEQKRTEENENCDICWRPPKSHMKYLVRTDRRIFGVCKLR